MFFKKSLILGCAIAFSSLSFTALASLHTDNYAPEDSTVKVDFTHICAGNPPSNKYTPASPDGGVTPGTSDANAGEIKALCRKDPCVAQIYMDRHCGGSPVATATLVGVGTDTHTVTNITILDTRYKIEGVGGSTVTIRKVG